MATEYLPAKGDLAVVVTNPGPEPVEITLLEASYKVAAGKSRKVVVPASKSACWYDFTVRLKGHEKFARRFAGRVETGRIGLSDPAMA
jgi:phospholipase C